MSSIHLPLLPATPAHTPQGSLGSIRSRTPGQLSLHDYRKQQQSSSPLSDTGSKRLKKKAAVLSLQDGTSGIPTAPPTPPNDTEFDLRADATSSSDEDDDAIIDANFIRYSVRTAKKEYIESREGASRRLLSHPYPHVVHHNNHQITASSSESSPSIIHHSGIRATPITIKSKQKQFDSSRSPLISSQRPRRVDASSPFARINHSPTNTFGQSLLPQIYDHTERSAAFTSSTQASITHCSMNNSDPIDDNDRDEQASSGKTRRFKTRKRLPRPSEPPVEPQSSSPAPSFHDSISPASESSHASPFSLSRFQWPIPTRLINNSIRKSQSYDPPLPPKQAIPFAAHSFTDLLHFYERDLELTKQPTPLGSRPVSSALGAESLGLHAFPVFAPKQSLTKMTSFMNDPYDSHQIYPAEEDAQRSGAAMPINRESSYTENWDSRSIIDINDSQPIGRALGIVDYSDVEAHDPQHDSYNPINSILDQYGRMSIEHRMPLSHRSAGRPPSSAPPPVPALNLPKLNFPIEELTTEHTTDYGLTRDLLRDRSSTPLEVPRSSKSALDRLHIPSEEYTPSVYDTSASPMPFNGDPETMSLAPSAVSDEWQTIANTSTNELTGNITSMADYQFSPFPTHFMPPLHATHQRRAVTYDEIPEVPSPHSTLPELDRVPRHGDDSPSVGYRSARSEYSPHMDDEPDTPDNIDYAQRYSLHDRADMNNVSRSHSPVESSSSRSMHKRSVGHIGLSPKEDTTRQVASPEHTSHHGPGIVDPTTLSSEPNDAIDSASMHSPNDSKRQTRVSLLLGRSSKRSSRNFSNQRNLIELQMPKRTSSLRATEGLRHGHQRVTQFESDNFQNASISVSNHGGSEDQKLDHIRTQKYSRAHGKSRQERRSRILGLTMTQQLNAPTQAFARPASSTASTTPLVYDTDHRHHLHHTQAQLSHTGGESGGLRQLYLAEEGAYSGDSPAMKGPAAAAPLTSPDYKQQLRRSRLWFALLLLFPFCLVLYSLGTLDRLAGPRGMLKSYKKWARNVVFVEIILILLALTVWGVTRRGT